ncbi:CPBP family intramembrane glutamic endopeptidase [Paenibacillus sp. DCT19]|uniref:CPBP family intramembrane glutamic endopeptidase n=1 Tax=Paenibacillus sp. DCT19 TaxID=2211212 RepID=UPI0013E3275D|nr:CPBP family intramembrane glutamic endopeptidase [Paenibacillus sp. DCT19]
MTNQLTMRSAGWIFFVSYVMGILFTAWISSKGNPHHDNLMLFLAYVAIGQIVLNVMPAVIWCRYRNISLRTAFKLHKVSLRNVILSMLIFALSQMILLFFHQLTEVVSQWLGVSYGTSYYPIADSLFSLGILLISIGIIPPICEELLFRGVLLSGYAKRGLWFAAIVSSFLFALFHDNPYRLIELFGAALVSAIIVIRSGSIIPGIIVHLITNSTYVISSYIQGGDMLEGMTTPEGPTLLILLMTGFASLITLMICRWLYTRFDHPETGVRVNKAGASAGFRSLAWMIPILLSIVVFVIKFWIEKFAL